MLIEFTVKNYASFKERTTLSAETGNRLRKLKETNTFSSKNPSLLKSLLLFGPNGSGKSQLIQALQTMEGIVTRPTQAVTDKLNYYPFLFDEKSKIEDTYFEVKLELKNKIYDYSFSYNRESITSEALTLINGNKEKSIFSRNGNDIHVSNKLLEDSIPKLRNNSLFLYLAQSENDADCIAIYKWFADDLLFIHDNLAMFSQEKFLSQLENKGLRKEIVSFLNFADLNIYNIRLKDKPYQRL
ncbi:AAA family ATPase [Lactobacillus crispatus]|uniref:AAA family ATPase n=1 Tax=Lactobacillus crispatus TaxID=47770 RepID=UPI0022CDE812|nr:AAA family ATPase [Lactobacillus crispatus]MCZ9662521.1 ATP-binding protein [Lactobacillus crispatus]